MYLIAGRSGAGKDYLARLLEKKGFKSVKSYSTRPKRYESEDTHIFISPEEASKITDKVATTVINGYEYFATKEQVENADIYIIDPNGINELVHNMPDTPFGIVYVCADEEMRHKRAINRGNKEEQEDIFQKRQESENAQFSAFEDDLIREKGIFLEPNVVTEKTITNFYQKKQMEQDAEILALAMKQFPMEVGRKFHIMGTYDNDFINAEMVENNNSIFG